MVVSSHVVLGTPLQKQQEQEVLLTAEQPLQPAKHTILTKLVNNLTTW